MKYKWVYSLAAAVFSAVAFISVNRYMSMQCVKTKYVKAKIKNLPKGLHGVKILHISDIHNTSKDKIDVDIWGKVFKEEFDIAFITGDLTKYYFDEVLPMKDKFINLTKKAPTFFVDGNHEKRHFPEIKAFMDSCGITVLDNKKINIDLGKSNVEILGIRDFYWLRAHDFEEFDDFMKNEKAEGFRLLLSHQPQIMDKLKNFKDIFVISGHTHAGQIRIPFMPVLIAPGQGFFPKYGAGFYKENGNYLYISSGIGASRIPLRLFNPPEIAVITLEEGHLS